MDNVDAQPPIDNRYVAKSTDRATVLREVTEGIKREGSTSTFLNNFATKLPGGMRWQELERYPDQRNMPTKSNPNEEDRVYFSDLYLEQTRGEFLDTIQTAIQQSGIDPVRLEELRLASHEANKNLGFTVRPGDSALAASQRILEEYLQFALPVYVQLRTMGYSHYDLVI